MQNNSTYFARMYTRGPFPSKKKNLMSTWEPCLVDLRIRSDLWGYRRERFQSHKGPWPDWWWECYVTPPSLPKLQKGGKEEDEEEEEGGGRSSCWRSEEHRCRWHGVSPGQLTPGLPQLTARWAEASRHLSTLRQKPRRERGLKEDTLFKNKMTSVSNLLTFPAMISSSKELITQQIISKV